MEQSQAPHSASKRQRNEAGSLSKLRVVGGKIVVVECGFRSCAADASATDLRGCTLPVRRRLLLPWVAICGGLENGKRGNSGASPAGRNRLGCQFSQIFANPEPPLISLPIVKLVFPEIFLILLAL
jgi:hypothetical protein